MHGKPARRGTNVDTHFFLYHIHPSAGAAPDLFSVGEQSTADAKPKVG